MTTVQLSTIYRVSEVPRYLLSYATEFPQFHWEKYTSIVTKQQEYRFILNGPLPLFYVAKNKVFLDKDVKKYCILNHDNLSDRRSELFAIKDAKNQLADRLESNWGIGNRADEYIDLAMNKKVPLIDLLDSSPFIFECFKPKMSQLLDKYMHLSHSTIAIAAHFATSSEEMDYLLELPQEVFEVLTTK
jgi:hypothetical protein